VKDQVSAQVIATKQQTAVNAFVQSLRDKATVEILLVTDTASTTPETTE